MVYLKKITLACLIAIPSTIFAHPGRTYFSSPVAGDVVTSGKTIALRWSPERGKTGTIRLSLWDQQTGQWAEAGLADYQTGSYNWTVPVNNGERLRLRGITDDGSEFFTNGFFSIAPPSIKSTVHSSKSNNQISMVVYPNPSTQNARISITNWPANTPPLLEILNEQGDNIAVLSQPNETVNGERRFSLNCSKLQSGTYFARIKNSSISPTIKILVHH